MDLDLLLLRGLYLCVTVVAIAFFAQRSRWKRRRRKNKSNWGFFPTSASMGNALHHLQALAQPQIQHILEQKLDEHADDEEDGAPKDPTAHLRRQARRIRRGQKVDRLTALHRP